VRSSGARAKQVHHKREDILFSNKYQHFRPAGQVTLHNDNDNL
jgi:hypothetical protein